MGLWVYYYIFGILCWLYGILYCKLDMKMEFLYCLNKFKDFLIMFKVDKVEINNEN